MQAVQEGLVVVVDLERRQDGTDPGQVWGGPVPEALIAGPRPLHLQTDSVVWHH